MNSYTEIISAKLYKNSIVCEISLISKNELVDLGNTILVYDIAKTLIKQILLQYFEGDDDNKFRIIKISLNTENILPDDAKSTYKSINEFEQFYKNHKFGRNYTNPDGGLVFYTKLGTQDLFFKKV